MSAAASPAIKVTQQQRDNQLSAREMWLTVPEINVTPQLMRFRELDPRQTEDNRHLAPDCGTVACFGGWCAWWPPFRAQGVYTDVEGIPRIKGRWSVSEALFGIFVFGTRYKNLPSKPYPPYPVESDWQIVMNRIDWMLANTWVVV